MLNEYKEKVMKDFDEKFRTLTIVNGGMRILPIEEIKQFIPDLIDEFSGAIPEELEYDDGYADGWNKCRATLINNL